MKRVWVILLLILLTTNLVAGIVFVGNESNGLQTQYGPNQKLKGWVNLSFSNEPSSSVFSTNFGDQISLFQLLNKSSSQFECIPSGCSKNYEITNGENTKSFSMLANEEKIIGLYFEGMLDGVSSVSFNITSDANANCMNQLKIDLFDNSIIEEGNNKKIESTCDGLKTYGCYDPEKAKQFFNLGSNRYCQEIKFPEAPAYELSAKIDATSGVGEETLTFEIYDEYGERKAECTTEISNSGDKYCVVDFLVPKEKKYFVCLSSEDASGNYQIRGYTSNDFSEVCGFSTNSVPFGGEEKVAAYSIFINPKSFADFGTMGIGNTLNNGNEFSGKITDWLSSRYGWNMNCSTGCVVPVKIISSVPQNIELTNLKQNYILKGIGEVAENKFYDVSEKPVSINSEFQKINLDEFNFSTTNEIGNHTITLKLNGENILSEEIFIEEIPVIVSLTPKNTVAGLPTVFTVETTSQGNISAFTWEFGDGTNITTTENQIVHSYNETNAYKFKITAIENRNGRQLKGYKIFDVIVGNPKEIANKTLKRKQDYLVGLKSNIQNNYSAFEQQQITKTLGIEEKERQIKNLMQDYETAISEDDYTEIMEEIVDLDIPLSVETVEKLDNADFVPIPEKINIGIISSISNEEYESEEELRAAYYAWINDNLNSKISYKKISAIYDYKIEQILNIFVISPEISEEFDDDLYFIIEKDETIEFENLNPDEEGDFYFIEIQDKNQFKFSTEKEMSFLTLSGFISPSLNELEDYLDEEQEYDCNEDGICDEGENWRNCHQDCSAIGFVIVLVIILFILFLVVYLLMQEWYKKNYETHLFQNRNYLFNLLNYINNMKAQNKDEGEIEKELKKAGWNSEQITYSMKKYKGKRMGMWEIPIEPIKKIFRKKKMDPKIQKPVRNPNFRTNINQYRNFNKGFK